MFLEMDSKLSKYAPPGWANTVSDVIITSYSALWSLVWHVVLISQTLFGSVDSNLVNLWYIPCQIIY